MDTKRKKRKSSFSFLNRREGREEKKRSLKRRAQFAVKVNKGQKND